MASGLLVMDTQAVCSCGPCPAPTPTPHSPEHLCECVSLMTGHSFLLGVKLQGHQVHGYPLWVEVQAFQSGFTNLHPPLCVRGFLPLHTLGST